MDLFQIPDDYKPQKPLSQQQMDEIEKYLTTHPLFMKQIPENIADNPHLAALQNIIYDEEPDIVAERLNKQGNERLKVNPSHPFYMKQAYRRYTEGINLNCPSPDINVKLHCNRAMINLKLKNYGKVIEDCKSALKLNPQYTKAYYRYAQALMRLDRYDQAVALLKNRQQKELKQVYTEALEGFEKKEKQKEQKTAVSQEKQSHLAKYCKQRGWKMKKRFEPIPGDPKVQFTDGKIVIPVMIMYPQFKQFDVLERITEQSNIKDSLSQILTDVPWDTQKIYNPQSVELYVQISPHVMLRLKSSLNVAQLLKVYQFPEAIEINAVCPKSEYYPLFTKDNKIIE